MINILIATYIGCSPVILENFTRPFTEIDNLVLSRANVVCEETYGLCVKSVEKKDETTYWVMCGGKKI